MTFTLSSPDFEQGETLPAWARAGDAGGEDRSPALAWAGAPEGTRSFVLTVFDPDAPRATGWWHWVVCDVPASVDALPANAGDPDAGLLPAGAVTHPNEEGNARYNGAGPPRGHGPHRYVFTLSALDVERLDVPAQATGATVERAMKGHVVSSAQLIGTSSTPD
jgi:Raf kinase inhibitor-like YbhB/YbcL family protein